jgi:hypothetical protein
MKTPIEPSEIRKGDLIRWEWADLREVRSERAVEYVSGRDGGSYSPIPNAGQHYLLDRPTPAVELPAEPTLGWLTYAGSTIFGVFRKYDPSDYSRSDGIDWDVSEIRDGAVFNSFNSVTAFTPATAVPTEQWAAVVAEHDQWHADREFCSTYSMPICALLAAVDKANGGAA